MNLTNENQHWISQHLLKRFKLEGFPFQCYQVETGEWVEIRGMLEEAENGARRIVVGSSREARGEYIKVIDGCV